MKLTLSTADMPRCDKRGCTYRDLMHRHHLGHQWIFVKVFRHRPTKRYHNFVIQYYEFRPHDVRLICPGHHALIHTEYDTLIATHLVRLNKTSAHQLASHTWREAYTLMKQLRTHYFKWRDILATSSNPKSDRLNRKDRKHRIYHSSNQPIPISDRILSDMLDMERD